MFELGFHACEFLAKIGTDGLVLDLFDFILIELDFFVTIFKLSIEELRVIGGLDEFLLFVLLFETLFDLSCMVLHDLGDSLDLSVEG